MDSLDIDFYNINQNNGKISETWKIEIKAEVENNILGTKPEYILLNMIPEKNANIKNENNLIKCAYTAGMNRFLFLGFDKNTHRNSEIINKINITDKTTGIVNTYALFSLIMETT